MTFFDAIKTCFAKYVDFSGRASRTEYWSFWLFCFIISFLIGVLDSIDPFLWIFLVIILAPSIAVSVRRLHDVNQTGWWLLVPGPFGIFSSMFGADEDLFALSTLFWALSLFMLLIFFCQKGDENENRFGPNPLA